MLHINSIVWCQQSLLKLGMVSLNHMVGRNKGKFRKIIRHHNNAMNTDSIVVMSTCRQRA